MEMDVYDHDSYMMSLGNLFMLKLFHEEGINVSKFPNFMVHSEYNVQVCSDIFWEGMIQLVHDAKCYNYDELEDFKSVFPTFKTGEGANPTPEYIITIQDSIFKEVLKGANSKHIKELLPEIAHRGDLEDVEVVILPDNSGIAYLCYYPTSEFHSIAEGIIFLKNEAIRLGKESKKELEDGYSNQFFNREPA